MIGALILVISIAAFVQFFVFYTRSIIAASRKHALSDNVREITGLEEQAVQAPEFGRLLQLVELCPGPGNDQMSIRAVRAYFSGLGLLLAILPKMHVGALGSAGAWMNRERDACAYFAATALDRRMAYSRSLLSTGASS